MEHVGPGSPSVQGVVSDGLGLKSKFSVAVVKPDEGVDVVDVVLQAVQEHVPVVPAALVQLLTWQVTGGSGDQEKLEVVR